MLAEILLVISFLLVVLILWSIPHRLLKTKTVYPLEPRKLTKEEATLFADYFHNEAEKPDCDGYVGTYILPEEVMEIYNEKYGKEREFE